MPLFFLSSTLSEIQEIIESLRFFIVDLIAADDPAKNIDYRVIKGKLSNTVNHGY